MLGYTLLPAPARELENPQYKFIINATEQLAHLRHIVFGVEFSRESFVTSTFVLQSVVNNLQRLSREFTARPECEQLQIVLFGAAEEGSKGLLYNVDRHTSAHVLNLEYFYEIHDSEEGGKLFEQWQEEFFAEGKLFDHLQRILLNARLYDADQLRELDDVTIAASLWHAEEGSGAASAVADGRATTRGLPKLVDHTMGERGEVTRAYEYSFSQYKDELLQLFNYHIRQALTVITTEDEAGMNLVEVALIEQSMQVVGNIAKILDKISNILPREQLNFLIMLRNVLSHSTSVEECARVLGEEVVVRNIHETCEALSGIDAATIPHDHVGSPELVEVEMRSGCDLSFLLNAVQPPSKTSGRGAHAGAAAGAGSRHHTKLTDDEILAAAMAEVKELRQAMTPHSEEITSTGSFTDAVSASEASKTRLATVVFDIVQKYCSSSAKKDAGGALKAFLTMPDMDINQTLTVHYTPKHMNKSAKRKWVKLSDAQKELTILEGVLSGELKLVKHDEGGIELKILPLNCLLILLAKTTRDGNVVTSPYFSLVNAFIEEHDIALSYMQQNNVSLNPLLLVVAKDNINFKQLEFTYNSQYIASFSEMMCEVYGDELFVDRSTKSALLENSLSLSLFSSELLPILSNNISIYEKYKASVPAGVSVIGASGLGNLALLKNILSSITTGEELLSQRAVILMAVQGGHVDMVEFLLSHDIPLGQLYDGVTLLHIAAQFDYSRVLELLLDKMDVRLLTANNSTALHIAAENNSVKAAKVLLAAGAELECLNKDNLPPLCKAVQNGCMDVAKVLILSGAEVGVTWAETGDNLFTIAAMFSQVEMMEFFLSMGFDINHQRMFGQTALHISVLECDLEAVNFLLAHGADRAVKDMHGKTALDYATSADRDDIVACFTATEAGHAEEGAAVASLPTVLAVSEDAEGTTTELSGEGAATSEE